MGCCHLDGIFLKVFIGFSLSPVSHFHPFPTVLGAESQGVVVQMYVYEMGHPF